MIILYLRETREEKKEMAKKEEKDTKEKEVLTKKKFSRFLFFIYENGAGKKKVCKQIEHYIDKHENDINTTSLKVYLSDLQQEDIGRNKLINKMRNYVDKIYR